MDAMDSDDPTPIDRTTQPDPRPFEQRTPWTAHKSFDKVSKSFWSEFLINAKIRVQTGSDEIPSGRKVIGSNKDRLIVMESHEIQHVLAQCYGVFDRQNPNRAFLFKSFNVFDSGTRYVMVGSVVYFENDGSCSHAEMIKCFQFDWRNGYPRGCMRYTDDSPSFMEQNVILDNNVLAFFFWSGRYDCLPTIHVVLMEKDKPKVGGFGEISLNFHPHDPMMGGYFKVHKGWLYVKTTDRQTICLELKSMRVVESDEGAWAKHALVYNRVDITDSSAHISSFLDSITPDNDEKRVSVGVVNVGGI